MRFVDGVIRLGSSVTSFLMSSLCIPTLRVLRTSSVQHLRADNNGFDKRGHLVPARGQPRTHRLEKRFIREHQRTAERVYKRLFTHIVQKILLATRTNIALQAVKAGALTGVWKGRA